MVPILNMCCIIFVKSRNIYDHKIQQSMDQPGKVANPACGQLNGENDIYMSPFAPENLVSRDGPGRAVHVSPLILKTQAPAFRDGVHLYRQRPRSVTGLLGINTVTSPWRSLPRVHWYKASSPQGSSRNRCFLI